MRAHVMDEAHLYYNEQRARREDLTQPPLSIWLRRLRKRGGSFILVSQSITGMEAETSNFATMVTFSMTNATCVGLAGTAMGLDKERSNAIPLLPERHAVVRNQELGRAVLFRVPELNFPDAPSVAELAREMEPLLAAIRPPEVQLVQLELQVAEQGQSGITVEESRASVGQASAGLSHDATTYLRQQTEADYELLPLTVFDRLLGWTAARGNQLRDELFRGGCIEIVTIRTGARGASPRIVKVTKKGYDLLKAAGVNVQERSGKGAIESQYWQKFLVRQLQKAMSGCRPMIEYRKGEKLMDVAVEHDGKLHCFEVQMAVGHVTENLVKDLNAGADVVVLCAVTSDELAEMQRRLERDLGEDWQRIRSKVEFRTLRSFAS